jgi:hypothetical protein
MTLQTWSKSNADYSRRLYHAALDGARSGQQEFLHGTALAQRLDESTRHAWIPAAIGACVGLFSVCPGKPKKTAGRALALGLVGGLVGFSAALAWENRRLATNVASSAWKKIGRVRDERWLERNPIDYA